MARGIANYSRRILLWGTALAVVLTGLLFAALNAPQCPKGYTQEQINTSNCIVGANIGLGLLIVCAPMLWAVSVFVTASVIKARNLKKKDSA